MPASGPLIWGTRGAGDGEFFYPEGIAVASDGSVYVADHNNHRIQKFTPGGVFVSKWGTFGAGDGEFKEPWGVALAPDGSVYVVDMANNRIQKFASASDEVPTVVISMSADASPPEGGTATVSEPWLTLVEDTNSWEGDCAVSPSALSQWRLLLTMVTSSMVGLETVPVLVHARLPLARMIRTRRLLLAS